MRKSIVTLAVTATVGFGTIFGGTSVRTEAASISSLKGEQNKIQEQRSDINSTINQKSNQITDLQNQQADVKDEITRLDKAIADSTNKINETTAKLESTKAEILELQGEMEVIKDRIEKRNILLKDRARSYQETGGVVNYLDVLMGSTSFSDFVGRANAVVTIMQADQAILKEHEADKQALETKQKQVQANLASIQKMVADLQTLKQQLNVQKADKDKLLASLKDQENDAHEGLMDLQEQDALLAAQQTAIQQAIKMEQEAQAKAAAEAARAAKAAAEAAKRQAASSHSSSSSSTSSSSSSGYVSSGSTPGVSSGYWTQPAAGYLSSGFGARGSERHVGVDIANPTAVPIVAAADGVVIRSYLSSSYGNCIFVSHSINGQVYTTVYAHMSTRLVGSGAVVKKGQQIGVMGNTGDSTGQHLHFELHKGPWTQDKRFAINPVGIVPLP
ncbi:peptidoglycan DD-metalloendopeptidase family protein [Neobacillus drentensis]|uniref:murein hydrolase activator EnvC family protein n=1 Tax=Neobacillus drentensis TaxID=220684 RepID=UPI001F4781AD|nr:peptidoglycan DD-metalloendopeptidase family protein [Neobacillus drentensis]ULT56425.1 peptidoglycan DD-metalloendopeptidase family protein [Neobacillus drentensis]